MVTPEAMQALNELVEKARSGGEAEPHVGKRQWKRYRYGTRLEVTRDAAVFASSWYVTTHNVSAGGVGFWSKQAFSIGEPLFIRERTSGQPGPWLASHVRYCITGTNGFLVGILFDHPGEPDAPFRARRNHSSESPSSATSSSIPFCSSLRSQSGLSAALVGAIVNVGTLLLCRYAQIDEGPLAYWAVGIGSSLLVGFGIGWLFLRRESHVLAAIRRATDGLSCGVPETTPLPEACTQEVAAVRQTILDLGIRWQQQADLECLQRQRLEEITQIRTNVLSTVSHDLRTPLTSIQLYAQMMKEDLTSLTEEDQHRFLGVISEECARLSRLVDDLLEVQRLERDDIDWPVQAHDLCETIRAVAEAFAPIAASNSLHFEVSCPDELTKVWCNQDKIIQAINNLLSNALKFTDAGGTIELAVGMVGAEVAISVTDTGKGIPREKWDAVFDRFVQLSGDTGSTNRGVGLGLHITRQIVERHKGRVWLNSEVGVGTEFCIALPIYGTRPTCVLAAASDYVAGQVVLCDADPELASVMAQELQGHGFEVRQAHCASRFFELIAERSPDIVICDIVLPDMSCQHFLDTLVQIQPRSFQLILHPAAGSFDELKHYKADIILRRPSTRSELNEAVGIAMYQRADRGAVVLVTTGWGIDGDRMSQVLTTNGHLPISVKDTTEAVDYLRKYPVDAVLVFVGPEGADSPKRHLLEAECATGSHLFLLMDIPDKHVCQTEVAEHVSIVPYRYGRENEVAAECSRIMEAGKAEVSL